MADFLALLAANAEERGGLTPVCQLTYSNDFARFLEGNNMTFDLEAGAAWLLLDSVNRVAPGVIPVFPNGPPEMTCALVAVPGAVGGAPAAVAYVEANTPANRDLQQGVPRDSFRVLLTDRNKALFWLLNLTACHQIKPLDAKNISNWFRMSSRVTMSGRTVLRVIDFAAVALPQIKDNEGLTALLANNQFMEYHTSYSSTAQLATEMLQVCPQVTNHIFSEATRNAVAASAAQRTSRQLNGLISQQVILATYAYLKVFNKLPEAWYQGEKAKSLLPANRFQLYMAVFNRIKDLTVATAVITDAATIEALILGLGDGLRNI